LKIYFIILTEMTLTRESARELCRTCLLQLDKEHIKSEFQSEEIPISQELQQLLNLNPSQDLENQDMEQWLPNELCLECRILVQNFERFRRKAEDCRKQLLEMLKKDPRKPTFEVVYEDGEGDERSLHSLEPPEPEPDPDPIDEPALRRDKSPKKASRGSRNTLKCSLCRHSFAHQITLAAHIRKVHEGSKRPFQCDQ